MLIRRARDHAGPEENVELQLLRRNDGVTTDVCCFDRQIQVAGTRRTLDIIGLTFAGAPALVAIEVKRYPDRSIQHVPGQLHDYLDMLTGARDGLRDDVAESYQTVCSQLQRLGLPARTPGQITAGMPVQGLAVVSDYSRKSELLPRAHGQARKLERSMYVCVLEAGEFVIPPPDRWIRLG